MKRNMLVKGQMHHAATEGEPVERYQRVGLWFSIHHNRLKQYRCSLCPAEPAGDGGKEGRIQQNEN